VHLPQATPEEESLDTLYAYPIARPYSTVNPKHPTNSSLLHFLLGKATAQQAGSYMYEPPVVPLFF
jgi:hypothetical protein